jgi:hypothetical protein
MCFLEIHREEGFGSGMSRAELLLQYNTPKNRFDYCIISQQEHNLPPTDRLPIIAVQFPSDDAL